jgi:uncharacterized protein YfaS (alpha-2-macroglobulin family)
MKRFLIVLSMLAAAASPSRADLTKADALFDKRLYQEALKEYDATIASSSGDDRLKAVYRAAESQALLFRYAEAAQRVFPEKLPQDPVWRGRFLLLRTELAREFLKQYGWSAPKDSEEGTKDLTKRTRAEWEADLRADYRKLWDLREALVARTISDEAYFVDLKDADVSLAPTLWDLAVLRWGDYLMSEAPSEPGSNPPGLSFLVSDYAGKYAPGAPPAVQAAAVFEESARMDGDGRETVRDGWKINRLMLPFHHPDKIAAFPDQKAARATAIALLRAWMDAFKSGGAAAEAGYQAAELLNEDGRPGETVELCRTVEKRFAGARAAKVCAKLRAQIELPTLSVSGRFAPPPGKDILRLSTRNLERVHVALYRVQPEEIAELSRRRGEDWSALRSPDRDLVKSFLSREPASGFVVEIKPPAPYMPAETQAVPPELKAGIYLAIASNDAEPKPGSSLIAAVFVNVTELFLIGSAGPSGPESDFVFDPKGPLQRTAAGFHLYALDARSGAPASGATIDAFKRDNWGAAARLSLTTDDAGVADVPTTFSLRWTDSSSFSLDPLARSGDSSAYWQSPSYFSVSVPAPIELHLETDRPIYRPGQTVRVKTTVLRRLPRGYKVYDGTSKLTVSVRDANGQELCKAEPKLNAMGSAALSCLIPTGRLLGQYSANASLSDFGHQFSGYLAFAVEEYKRPEFEVKVDESTGIWRYGRAVSVGGEAKYYFGGAVPDAPVTYRVTRSIYIPWFCWWWRWQWSGQGPTEVASGQVKTGPDGKFNFPFTPQPYDPSAKNGPPSHFTVSVESRDPGGRTITAERSFTAGDKSVLLGIEPPAGFARAGKTHAVAVKLLNLNEKPQDGTGSFALYRLGDPPAADGDPQWGGRFEDSPPLEQVYKDVPNGPEAAAGKLRFSKDKPAPARLPGLAEGAYRLVVRADDPAGGSVEQSVIVLSAGEGRTSLPLRSVSLAEHATVLRGEKARLLIGSAGLSKLMIVEIWGGQSMLERRVLSGGGVRVLEIPVTDDHKGGFTVRWFGAKDFKIRAGQVRVDVPWKDRELTVKLKHDAVMKPGEKVRWSLSISNRDGKAVDGEAAVRVYDRSLEYYAGAAGAWTSSLYAARWTYTAAQGSLFQPWGQQLPVEEGWVKKMLDLYQEAIQEPQAPGLRLNRSRVYRRGRFAAMKSMAAGNMRSEEALDMVGAASMGGGAMAAPAAAAPQLQETSSRMKAKDGEQDKKREDAGKAPLPEVAARKDFSETAFFEPQLKVKDGKAFFSFTAPERLTSWKTSAVVLTRDVKRGTVEAESVTRKDLMVRVEMPRFYREGDEGLLQAIVHNETNAPLTGTVTLSVTEDGKDAASKLGLTGTTVSFSAQPHGIAPLSWNVKAPRGTTDFMVRAVARAGTLADAEERELPILPSRERLIETAFVVLDGAVRKTLSLPTWAETDPTREHESIHLQVDPQLALIVLNSLPSLIHYPYECTEQLLDRYVPLAIVNAFYRKYPALAAAAKKIPKRKTITPAWDRSDPRRLTRLMESPWEETSKGISTVWPIVDMFDPKTVEAELADSAGKLKSYQLADGSFPWFPGGRSSPYMTLLVLAGFAEAQRYGVTPPPEIVPRALAYVNREIPKHLKPEEGELSLILYSAYVVTSFPKTMPGAAQGWRFAKAWADYADKYTDALTPFGRGYAAYVYWRLGEREKADSYLARALDGIRVDPIAGAYWAPEKISWLWYNDTVEKHAFFLRTLLTLKPKDPRIPGMVQWLLFNRKGSEWKSTKASAAAIYSLLDVLQSRGALDKGDEFKIKWGPETETAQVEPFDWLSKPLRWSRSGAEVQESHGKAVIDKTGPGFAFASLTWIYSTDKPPKASGPGMLEVERTYFRRDKAGDGYKLSPLASGDTVAVGDQLEVRLTVKTRSQFEYVQLKDPRGAGFEGEELRSGWKWDLLSRYEEPRDSLTNFFIDWLPHGEYKLGYRVRPTTPGTYRIGAAVLQSMYAPEFTAHSDGMILKVKP